MAKLPESVQQIADVIGRDDALALVRSVPRWSDASHSAGRPMLYIPKAFRLDSPIVGIIGAAGFKKLISAFGGETLKPALCPTFERNEQIAREVTAPAHMREAAKRYGLSVRRVRSIVRASEAGA